MGTNDRNNEILPQLARLIESIAHRRMKQLDLGGGIVLYRGEIHLLQALGEHPGMYMSELAAYFGVSRAMISKSAARLEERGFIKKEADADNKKKIRLFLSEKGRMAFLRHRLFHEKNDSSMHRYLNTLSPNELDCITEFLKQAQKMVTNHF